MAGTVQYTVRGLSKRFDQGPSLEEGFGGSAAW